MAARELVTSITAAWRWWKKRVTPRRARGVHGRSALVRHLGHVRTSRVESSVCESRGGGRGVGRWRRIKKCAIDRSFGGRGEERKKKNKKRWGKNFFGRRAENRLPQRRRRRHVTRRPPASTPFSICVCARSFLYHPPLSQENNAEGRDGKTFSPEWYKSCGVIPRGLSLRLKTLGLNGPARALLYFSAASLQIFLFLYNAARGSAIGRDDFLQGWIRGWFMFL